MNQLMPAAEKIAINADSTFDTLSISGGELYAGKASYNYNRIFKRFFV